VLRSGAMEKIVLFCLLMATILTLAEISPVLRPRR
jgi:hypothetical protein